MRRKPRRSRGFTLIEAIVALALLAIAASSLLALTRSILIANQQAMQREREIRNADRLLEPASLWSQAELLQRLGTHEQGQFELSIQRVTPDLFDLTVTDGQTGRPLLHTVVYRRVAGAGEP